FSLQWLECWRAILYSLTIFPVLVTYCSYNSHCKHSFNDSGARRILRAVSPVFRENVADDLLGNGLLRRQKQVIHDRAVPVLHGQRIRDVLEPGDLLQSISKGRDDGIVILLHKIRRRKQVTLRGFSVGDLLPRFVAPKPGHPLNAISS